MTNFISNTYTLKRKILTFTNYPVSIFSGIHSSAKKIINLPTPLLLTPQNRGAALLGKGNFVPSMHLTFILPYARHFWHTVNSSLSQLLRQTKNSSPKVRFTRGLLKCCYFQTCHSNSSQRKDHQIKNADFMRHSTTSVSSNVTLFISFSKTLAL